MKPAWLKRAQKPKAVIVDGVLFATKGEAARYVSFRDQVTQLVEVCRDDDRGVVLFQGVGAHGIWRESYHLKTKGKNKFGAKQVVFDGITFDSKREATHYGKLKRRRDDGEITNLELQVPFALIVMGVILGYYIADFVYTEAMSCLQVIVDAKGMKTPMYRWKKKHLAAQTGIQIREV